MLILINAIVSFIGAFLGAWAYESRCECKKLKEVPLRSNEPYQQLPEAPPAPIKRKRRTSDQIAIEKDRAMFEQNGNVTVIQ
jgi:hypothetical protein